MFGNCDDLKCSFTLPLNDKEDIDTTTILFSMIAISFPIKAILNVSITSLRDTNQRQTNVSR